MFDYRLIHANIPSNGGYRMTTYVSYQRKSAIPAGIQEKRLKAFEESLCTGHWCYTKWFGLTSKDPHTYGKPIPKPLFTSKPTYESVRDLI